MPAPIEALCLLARAPRLDAARLRACLAATGCVDALLAEPPAALRALGLHDSTVAALVAPDRATLESDVATVEGLGLSLLVAGDAAYPSRLGDIPGAPAVLWVRGCVATLSQPQLAVVGSRHPTALGRRTAREFAYHFASAGLAITHTSADTIDMTVGSSGVVTVDLAAAAANNELLAGVSIPRLG